LSDLAKKTIKNSAYGLIEYIWPIILAFFLTPLIIRGLGIELYGIYILSTLFIGFLTFLDLGMTAASLKEISFFYGQKKYNEINNIFGATLAAYLFIGIAGSIIVVLITEPLIEILKISAENIKIARFAFYFMAILFPINVMVGAISIIPKAIQRYDISTKISLFITTSHATLLFFIFKLGFGLKEVLIMGAITNLIAGIFYFIFSRRNIKGLKINFNYDKDLIKRMFKFGGYASITNLSGTILFHLDKIIIGAILGVASVSYYSVPSNLSQKIHGGVTALTNIIFPLSSELKGKGQNDKIVSMYFRSFRLIIMLTTAGVTSVLIFHKEFISYWLGHDFASKSSFIFFILLITYYIVSYSAIPFYLTMGAGKSKVTAFFSSINALINIILIFLFINKFGLIGVAYAYLLSVITTPIFMRYAEKRILGLKGFEVILKNLDIYFSAIIQGVISYFVILPFANSLFTTIIFIVISFISFFIIMYLFRLYKRDDIKIIEMFVCDIKRS
jgi:O-antigen/teichoic acid export membrane protein